MKLHKENIEVFISEWIAASNAFDTKGYLRFYSKDVVLDDPSVGRKFIGLSGIKDYFESYFIGYNTYTRIVKLDIPDDHHANLSVEFTGNFPEGKVRGTFNFIFAGSKITSVKATLV